MPEIFTDDGVDYTQHERYEIIREDRVGRYCVHPGAAARMDCGPEAEVEAKTEAVCSTTREAGNIGGLQCTDLIARCSCNKKEDWSFDVGGGPVADW